MVCKVNIIVFSIAITLATPALAMGKNPYSAEQFNHWVERFCAQAKEQGISQKTITRFKKHAELVPQAIQLDKKQPIKSKTFDQYLDHVLPKARIQKARRLMAKHDALLNEISAQYNVQKRFIVALWGIESDFGRNMGNFNIPNALATLAFEGRRERFFTKELIHALTIIDQGHISYHKMKGSWAGAMGQTQFMPSSFLELSVDYNQDGKRDIWHSLPDAFASIANYLQKRGWDQRSTWGRKIKAPSRINNKNYSNKTLLSLDEWSRLGVTRVDNTTLPKRQDIQAALIALTPKHRYLTYNNYRVLLNWNRSTYFATAVGLFSDNLR